MSGLPSTNLRIPWDAVLSALRIPFHSMALPLRTRCPLCGEDGLHLYNDTTSGGVWHHCRHCGSSGDIIELACSVWEVGHQTALVRLAASGVPIPEAYLQPEQIASYVYNYPGYRARMTELWRQASDKFYQSRKPHIAKIVGRYGLRLDVSPERWRDGPGLLVGVANNRLIERTFQPNNMETADNYRASSPYRVFKGAKWDDVLVVPFHDLPNRIRAFQFFGRLGRRPEDEVFRGLSLVAGLNGARHFEAGLCGYASVQQNDRDVIAVADWMLMLQVQFRHFRTSMSPMPIVGWHDDGRYRTREAWTMLNGKRLVFWSPFMNARVLRQVVETDAMMSTAGPTTPGPAAMNHWLRDHAGGDVKRAVLHRVRPWANVVGDWMTASPSGQVDDLVAAAEQSGVDVSYVLRRVGKRDAVSVYLPAAAPRAITMGNVRVVEQNDTWTVTPKHGAVYLLSNAVLRITHAIKERTTGVVYYYGSIRFKGSVVPFIAPMTAMQNKTSEWIQAKLAEAGLGVYTVVPHAKSKLHFIATAFHVPEFLEDDLVNWVRKLNTAGSPACPKAAPC